MKQFGGFPAKMKFTAVPDPFLAGLLPQIEDIAELKVTLYLFQLLYRKRGYPRFVTWGELLGCSSLVVSLSGGESPAEVRLRCALDMASQRGTFLHITLNRDEVPEDIYFLNTAANRQMISRIQCGDFTLTGWQVLPPAYVAPEELPDVFTLYEQNMGIITPMIADELKEAEKLYPQGWIRDAIKEAVALNKRSWRYVSRILERWSAEGRVDGAYQRDSEKTDPDKYIKGKYGHMVQR